MKKLFAGFLCLVVLLVNCYNSQGQTSCPDAHPLSFTPTCGTYAKGYTSRTFAPYDAATWNIAPPSPVSYYDSAYILKSTTAGAGTISIGGLVPNIATTLRFDIALGENYFIERNTPSATQNYYTETTRGLTTFTVKYNGTPILQLSRDPNDANDSLYNGQFQIQRYVHFIATPLNGTAFNVYSYSNPRSIDKIYATHTDCSAGNYEFNFNVVPTTSVANFTIETSAVQAGVYVQSGSGNIYTPNPTFPFTFLVGKYSNNIQIFDPAPFSQTTLGANCPTSSTTANLLNAEPAIGSDTTSAFVWVDGAGNKYYHADAPYYNAVYDPTKVTNGTYTLYKYYKYQPYDPNTANSTYNSSCSGQSISVNTANCETVLLPVTFGDISATLTGNNLQVNWTALTEENVAGYEVQISKDGKNYTTISTLKSKNAGGNSNTITTYGITTDATTTGLLGITLAITALFASTSFSRRKKMLTGIAAVILAVSTLYACSKQDASAASKNTTPVFIRIKQTDIDGAVQYSRVIRAVQQ